MGGGRKRSEASAVSEARATREGAFVAPRSPSPSPHLLKHNSHRLKIIVIKKKNFRVTCILLKRHSKRICHIDSTLKGLAQDDTYDALVARILGYAVKMVRHGQQHERVDDNQLRGDWAGPGRAHPHKPCRGGGLILLIPRPNTHLASCRVTTRRRRPRRLHYTIQGTTPARDESLRPATPQDERVWRGSFRAGLFCACRSLRLNVPLIFHSDFSLPSIEKKAACALAYSIFKCLP